MGPLLMIQMTRTTTAMLEDLFDARNDEVWSAFDSRYRPLIVGFAKKLGLKDEDAADVAQETLTQFVKEYRQEKYDRTRGRLRSWLIGIAKYRVAALRRKAVNKREWRGQSAIDNLEDPDQLKALWEQERRVVMLQQAMAELRSRSKTEEKTIQVFERLMFDQQSAAEVAGELSLSVQDVYLCKSRVAQKVRKILERLDALYDAGG